jgi:hypothetical protein
VQPHRFAHPLIAGCCSTVGTIKTTARSAQPSRRQPAERHNTAELRSTAEHRAAHCSAVQNSWRHSAGAARHTAQHHEVQHRKYSTGSTAQEVQHRTEPSAAQRCTAQHNAARCVQHGNSTTYYRSAQHSAGHSTARHSTAKKSQYERIAVRTTLACSWHLSLIQLPHSANTNFPFIY